ncbi:Ig-like domain-containing protein [Alkalihalobacillus deserti]|uniref:Ig-like domain-containing protein n=1 Tax=Alkalihalobacillus deserti TaxID=2879466 RepID=UPI001D14C8A9|nr:Ig-like domain-containing protein [Alkalihalobacillus deserti]
MKRSRLKRCLVYIMIVLLLLPPINGLAEGDSTPPVLESLEVSPKQVGVGETVEFTVEATDDQSGVRQGYVTYRPPSSTSLRYIYLKLDSNTGLWRGSYSIQEYDGGGEWQIAEIVMYDYANNRLFNSNPSSEYNFIVENEEGDITPPVLESLIVSPKKAGVGETVEFTAEVTDDQSGVRQGYVTYRPPSGTSLRYIYLKLDSNTGLWRGSYFIQEYDGGGEWQIAEIVMYDNANNRSFNSTPSSEYNFTVTHGEEEPSPPEVEEPPFIEAPIVNEITDQSTVVTGMAPVGTTVEVKIEGSVLGSTMVEEGGYFQIEVPLQHAGTEVSIVAADNVGNKSEVITRIVVDVTPPEAPSVGEVTDQTTEVTGQADPNSTIVVKVEDQMIGTVGVSEDGSFIVAIPQQDAGTVLQVLAIDQAGHESEAITRTVEGIRPLADTVLLQNENWTSNTIKGDVYVGPEAVLTINGSVSVEGNMYVLGAVRNFGHLNVTGTVYANQFSWGNSTLYHGTFLMLGGSNSIGSMNASSQPIKEMPLEIYADHIVSHDGIFSIEGATLPIMDLYVEGSQVEVRSNGTFKIKDVHIGSKENIIFTFVDVFGNHLSRSFPVEVVDTIPPAAPEVDEIHDQMRVVKGQAEPNSIVEVERSNKVIGTTTVREDGSFEVEIPVQHAGSILKATGTDEAGNRSLATEVTVQLSSVWTQWEQQTSKDRTKEWTIALSSEVNDESLHHQAVYVTTTDGRIVGTELTLGEDSKSVKVKPLENYQINQSYYLYITDGLTSVSGSLIQDQIVMKFLITDN